MSDTPKTVREEDLMAYVDGQLDEKQRAEIERHLAESEADRLLVEEWQAQNQTLHALFPDGDETVPLDLDPREIERNLPANDGGYWSALRSIAAGIVLLFGGALGGWYGNDLLRPNGAGSVAQLAINAHNVYSVDKRHPVEVTADQSQHLVTWLSKRLGTQLIAPDLSSQDFDLVGGRLLAATGGAAAQFMYEDSQGRRITLFVTPNEDQNRAQFEYAAQGQTNAFYWLDPKLNFTLVGAVGRDQLLGLATSLYNQWEEELA